MAAARVEPNPFEYQEPLLPRGERGVVVPRTSQLERALQLLARGGFLAIAAPPRSGVTTFLYMLRDRLPKAVYLDLANFALAAEPSHALGQALVREAAAIFPGIELPAVPVGVADVLSAVGFAPAAAGSDFAVIVDGFDVCRDEVSCQLVLALRAAYTERRLAPAGGCRLSIVTGSAVDLRELTSFGRTSPLNIAQHLFLSDFDETEVRAMFERGLAGDEDCDRWSAQAWRWTEGHPALTQSVGSHVFEEHGKNTNHEAACRRVFAVLQEEAALILGSTIEILNKRAELWQTAAQVYSGMPVPFERLHRPIRELLHLGLIRIGGNGLARPRNALFQQVLATPLHILARHSTADLPSSLRRGRAEAGAESAGIMAGSPMAALRSGALPPAATTALE